MGAITTPDPIYASDINNFQGELFKVGGQRTPFLSAMGGLTGGGKVIQSTFFQFQTADNATISSAPTEGTEGGAPTEYLGRNRGAYTQVTQIFHKGVKMSYTAMAAYNQQNPFTLGAAGYPASDGDGTTTNTAQLALMGGNPITDELAEQLELALEKIAREVEYFAINGTFADGAHASNPIGDNRTFRGLAAHTALNGGNKYFNTSTEATGGTAKKLDWDAVAKSLKTLYDANAPVKNPVLLVNSANLLELNKQLHTPQSGGTTAAVLPRDRNVGGIDIDTVITPFGSIGMMALDGNILGSNDAFIVDMAYVSPIFTNIPGKGTVFVRDIDQDDNARVAKAIYMEMGIDFGPPQYHLHIDEIATP